MNKICCL